MGESAMAGLSNSAYANWLTSTACGECSCVEQLVITFTNGNTETISESSEICNWMQSTDADTVATLQAVTFSGEDSHDQPWTAIDDRVTANLERVANDGHVAIKIKRPIGW